MNFLGVLLIPFTLLYDAITRFRNYLYDSGYKKSFSFETNVIAVGNLTVGGTGKSPMVEYLIRILKGRSVVTLSRGYGRKTKGFRLANKSDTPVTIGDEPYQFFRKFPEIHVAVGEERAIAIPFILAELPETEVILLDDAFQHRPVKPSLNIMLTDYNRPFFHDFVLPSGRLRENRKGAKRADIVVVTKCPEQPDIEGYEQNIRKYNQEAHIAFSSINYLPPVACVENVVFSHNIFLFTGIANHSELEKMIAKKYNLVGKRHFPDHYHYTSKDMDLLRDELQMSAENTCLVTTEKDMVKLLPLLKEFTSELPLFYIPIETKFLKGGEVFEELVMNNIKIY